MEQHGLQKSINIPYVVNQTDEGHELLVAAPDGNILDFDLTEQEADRLDAVLEHAGLWRSFFQSVIESLARTANEVA